MKGITYVAGLDVTPHDLGIEIDGDVVRLPEGLRAPLEKMGVRTADSLAAVLQSFPTAMASQLGMDAATVSVATAGALEKLRPFVDQRIFAPADAPERRGLGALPPGWLRRSS
jgi:hypothetical protein